jgi:hypothetical protein
MRSENVRFCSPTGNENHEVTIPLDLSAENVVELVGDLLGTGNG